MRQYSHKLLQPAACKLTPIMWQMCVCLCFSKDGFGATVWKFLSTDRADLFASATNSV